MLTLIRRMRRRGDEGYVLPAVLGVSLLMLTLVATALTVTLSGTQKANTDSDWNAALAAAYAGIEDYTARIENDVSYSRFGNPDAPFSTGSNVSLPPVDNAAFDATADGEWASVAGSDGKAQFRYEVDTSRYIQTGTIRLRSTGKVGNQTRSVVADLKQVGFQDYVYYTMFEVQDPRNTGAEDDYCGNYWWERPPQQTNAGYLIKDNPFYNGSGVGGAQKSLGDLGYNPRSSAACADIQFASTDVLTGKVHSNDRMLIDCGAWFDAAVTTAARVPAPFYGTTGGTCSVGTNPDRNTFRERVVQVSAIDLPDTNQELIKETRNDLPDEVPLPGCLYTGPTVIALRADGRMQVWSPYTRYTRTAASPSGATAPAECGVPGDGAGGLASPSGATVPIPDNSVVYVQDVPGVSSDPNYWPDSSTEACSYSPTQRTKPCNFTCSGTGEQQGWKIAGGDADGWATVPNSIAQQVSLRYPASFPGNKREVIPASSTREAPAYPCRKGDAFVQGVVDGRLTIGSQDSIYVTGDIRLENPGDEGDMIGLVANMTVWIWDPIGGTVQTICDWRGQNCREQISGSSNLLSLPVNNSLTTSPKNERTVEAAIAATIHTIQVQNYSVGSPRGTLTILGSMAQRFRGPVGTRDGRTGVTATGFNKNYEYDERLAYSIPPHYIQPTSINFDTTQVAGAPAGYDANGAPR